ncbi:MAG: IreB family regulatory phosphoprotein, partial [Erysipelotrichaceae bacterium]|nr:IreB family regulatory phosphoprotein [Erysipelotrichaceae bacterium]
MADRSSTMLFSSKDVEREYTKQLLKSVQQALEERGYNAVNQLSGYLISGDPAYISSHNNARSNIQSILNVPSVGLDRTELASQNIRAARAGYAGRNACAHCL